MNFLVVGINHTHAAVSLREEITRRFENTAAPIHTRVRAFLQETVFVSTCNRIEVYAAASDMERGERALQDMFRESMSRAASPKSVYAYRERAAIQHLFSVASGMDSLVLGEFEILGQIRRTYEQAVADGTVGSNLHSLFQAALRAGKRVRAETEIGKGAHSIAYATIALARKAMGDLRGRRALVIGAGEMGRRVAENLQRDAQCRVLITNRTFENAQRIAQTIHARAVPFSEWETLLPEVDLVVSTTRAPNYLVRAEMLTAQLHARAARPLLLMDLAVPRNIEPQCAQIENVTLLNVDDLARVVAHTRAQRARAVHDAQTLLAQETETFWRAHQERRAAPLLQELYTRAEQLRQAELDTTLRRLQHLALTERDREIISAFSSRLVTKLLAAPTMNLKAQMQTGDEPRYFEALRALFDLGIAEPVRVEN